MSHRKAALFVRKATTKRFLSKFVYDVKGGEVPRFSSAGWVTGNPFRQFLVASQQTSKKAFNSYATYYQNVRGFRSGKTPPGVPGDKAKKNKTTILTALEDSGNRMADRSSLFLKPISFTVFVAGASFVGTSIWQYEIYRARVGRNFSLSGWIENAPVHQDNGLKEKVGELRRKLHDWWSQLPPGGDVFWGICGVNTLVWLAWRVPALSPFMVTYFTATPIAKAVCLPMVLSVFSHFSLLHLAANMFVLHSFMPSTVQLMGREQFVGFYLTAGVVSSLGSHIYKILLGTNVPSLGASGAVMGILGYICTRIPDSQLGIIFIPGFSFSADTALKCILAVDAVGMLAGWKFMDHAAHLSGCLFGIAFSYIEKSLDPVRNSMLEKWHNYRSRMK